MITHKWFFLQNWHMDLSFQEKKTIWKSDICLLRYQAKNALIFWDTLFFYLTRSVVVRNKNIDHSNPNWIYVLFRWCSVGVLTMENDILAEIYIVKSTKSWETALGDTILFRYFTVSNFERRARLEGHLCEENLKDSHIDNTNKKIVETIQGDCQVD